MRRDALFAGTTVFATVLALVFWNQLRESNKLTARLQQQLEALAGASNGNPVRSAAGNVAPQPAVASVAAQAPTVAQVVAGEANRLAPDPQSKCEAGLARAKQSAADAMAEWAVELKLTPAETLRITEVRLAQVVARSSCHSAAGSNVDQEHLRVQFQEALGPSRLAELVELNASRITQTYMSYLGKQFKDQDVPLNDEQARQLSTFYLEEFRRAQREDIRRVYPDGPRARLVYEEELLKLVEERLGRVQNAAQSYLRPEQMAQLRSIAKTEIAGRRSSLQVVRESLEQGRSVPLPPLPSIATVSPQR